jgi:LuxR family maltose regulon positive regulatory protein
MDQTTRRLLIRTSNCELVCGALADAVCESTGSGELLSGLAAANSFVTPVGHDGVWFRSHPLFREVLRHLLRGEKAVVQQRIESRAARWHDGQGNLVEALEHALRAADWAYATDLLERGAFEQIFFHDGERSVGGLSAYLDAASESTPPDLRHRLVAAQAAVACMLGRQDRARELAVDIEALGTSGSRSSLADVARLTLAARSGDRGGVDAAVAALVAADPGGVFEAFALSELGAVHVWQLADGLAVEALERALALAMQLSLSAVALASGGRLVLAHCAAGRLSIAEKYALDAARINSAHPRIPDASAAPFHIGTADLATSRGDLEGCARAMQFVDVVQLRGRDPALSCAATLVEASALQAAGDYLGARATILSDPSCSLPGAWSLRAVSATMLLELVAQSGRPLVAIHAFQHGDPPTNDFLASRTHLARARAHLAAGDAATAELMVRRVITASRPATTPLLVAAVIVESETALANGDEIAAVEGLTRAIDLSAHEGISLPFLEATPRFEALLSGHPSLAARWPVPLRSAPDDHSATHQRRGLPEPLTDRELSVLRWLATRMTTAEIATELFVSMNTVKTHLASIYRKLESNSRREAVDRGRELHLI